MNTHFIEYTRLLREIGDSEKALQTIQHALTLEPRNPNIRQLLAESLYSAGKHDEVAVELNSLLAESPQNKEARFLLATVHQETGDFEAAKTLIEEYLQGSPQDYDGYLVYAVLLSDHAEYTQGRRAFDKALKLRPDSISARIGLGKLLYEVREYDQACDVLKYVYAISPNAERCTYFLALSCLASGKVAAGFDYYSEQSASDMRQALKWVDPQRTLPSQSPKGRRVLVRREQGLGDEIRFAGCYEDIAREADSCILQCDERLAPIFRRSFPNTEIYPVTPIDCPHDLPSINAYDVAYLAGDLPSRYRRSIDAFPERRSTLIPNPKLAAIWKERLSALGPGLKIGICWRSEQVNWFRMRNAFYSHIEDWGDILKCPGASFVNLFYGECSEELRQAEQAHGVKIHRWPDLNLRDDLDSVFALVSELDVVITAQTAVWNIAGSVGTETWATLNPIMYLGTDSIPWYNCVDPIPYELGDTTNMVLDRIAARLRKRVAQDGPQ